MFQKYYMTSFKEEFTPSDIEYREFGFLYWYNRKFVRHLGFTNFQSMKDHINSYTPAHVYCSAARYETPDAPNMGLKSYMDCDLIFDLDIDHIPTPCKNEHDKWVCKSCGTAGVGIKPEVCPSDGCGSNSFQETTWECEKCMAVAKTEISVIINDFLARDFGLDPENDLFIIFSGRRGYHIHVENKAVRSLDSNARREVVDYIVGKGLVPSYHGLSPNARKKPSIHDGGWRGRIARLVLKLLDESSIDELQKILTRSVDIERAKREISTQLRSQDPSWSFAKMGDKTWKNLIETTINKYGGKIDEPVTIDTHRLIRLQGSLHGKTGFLVKRVPLSEFEEFDPFKDAQVFGGTKRIHVKEAPQFKIGGDTFGPYKDEYVEIPLSAAVFLLCKGVASL
jgi:DNA primase small subunit